MMSFDESRIKYVLSHPSEQTENYENRYLIWRMLQALYSRQTGQEQSSLSTRCINGVGFNKYDAPFLTNVAKQSLKYKNLTWPQALAVGKCLQKYHKQLLEICASYAPVFQISQDYPKHLSDWEDQDTKKGLNGMAREGIVSSDDEIEDGDILGIEG